YVRLGPFANVEDSPGGTDEDNDNYFAAHGIVDCADGPTEIWVRDEVASTDYTIAGAGQSSPLSANVYRVYYYDYDQGWIAAPTDGGTGHPHIPSCSTEDLAFLGGAQVPVVVTIGIDESASAQEFYVAFNPRDRFNADSQFNRLSVDEWYVHPKEDPTMDLVLAFPSPLSASLLGDSNFKEHLWSSGPTNCTTATMDGSRRCGHLMWAMQEIGPLAIGDDSYNLDTAATAGFELCNQFDTGGTEFATMADSVNADYGFHGSLMNALLSNPAKTVKSYVFMALGENDNGKPSALEKCFDRVREKIRKAGAVPVFLTQPHYWGDTNVTPRTPEAGGSTQFDLWWDEFMVRMILDGTFYAGVPAVGDSAQ
ncbi:MAG: hypothetical protein ACE5EV_02425, partial [Gaiellales bacterium]